LSLRVLIADHQRLTLEALKEALSREEGFKVVAETSSAGKALELVPRATPDVVLIDVNLTGAIDGLTCVERLAKSLLKTRVIAMSGIADEGLVAAAFRRGAQAFISKSIDPRDLGPAIRQTVQRTVFHPPLLNGEDGLEGLSPREAAVLSAAAAGMSNRVIAQRLWVTEHTVKFHLGNVFRKLGVANRTEASRWAHSHGLVVDADGGEHEIEIKRQKLVEPELV
jgi:DNA-binding NarL/FixJ family response regulator